MTKLAIGTITITLLQAACFVTFVLSFRSDTTYHTVYSSHRNNTVYSPSYFMTTKVHPANNTDNLKSHDPNVTGVFQTTGPVNIYLYGGRATYDTSGINPYWTSQYQFWNDGGNQSDRRKLFFGKWTIKLLTMEMNQGDPKNPSVTACDCPAGPKGPKGDQGLRGPPGPPGSTFIQNTNKVNTPFVAFSVVMEQRFGPHDVYKVVLFDKVITNIGDGYRYSTGLFQAPYSGVYQFNVHIHTVNKNRAEVKLRIKSKEQLSIWADGMIDDGSHEMGSSNSLIIHMTKGDIAYCVLPKGQVLAGLRFTSFSGYLLHADPRDQGQGQQTISYATQGYGQGQPTISYATQGYGQSKQVSHTSNFVNNVQNQGGRVHQNPYTTGNERPNKQQEVHYVIQGQGQTVPQEIPQLIQGRGRSRMRSNPNQFILNWSKVKYN